MRFLIHIKFFCGSKGDKKTERYIYIQVTGYCRSEEVVKMDVIEK